MRLAATSLLLFLAQALTFVVDANKVDRRALQQDAQQDSDNEINSSMLDESFQSVVLLLAQADGQKSDFQSDSAEAVGLHSTIKALDELANSLIHARTAVGLHHGYELNDPLAAPLVNALSTGVPTRHQEASKYLRIITTAVHRLLREDGYIHDGSNTESRESGGVGMVPEHSYPLLRRATVARLTQLWLLHLRQDDTYMSQSGYDPEPKTSTWVANTRREVDYVLLMLFSLHRSGMRARIALEFLHISKAAGTSMCHLAEVSGCRTLDFSMGRTCLMRDFDDQPRWINGTHHWKLIAPVAEPWGAHPYAFLLYGVPRLPNRKRTCFARHDYLAKHNWNFFANEYTIYNNLTAYFEPEEDDDEDGAGLGAGGKVGAVSAPLSPPSPPVPRPPPAPPQSVTFEEKAARYASFVMQLVAADSGKAGQHRFAGSSRSSSSSRSRSLRSTDSSSSSSDGRSLRSSRSRSRSRRVSAISGGAALCPSFANVVVLRDPAERFLSHLKFIAQTYGTKYKWPSIAQAFAPGRNSSDWWRAFIPPLFDNYVLRTLAGEAVFAMSYEALEAGAESYMELAKVMLAQYDVILILEVNETLHRRAVHFGLAWRHLLTEFQLRNASVLLKTLYEMRIYGAQLASLLPDESLLEQLKPAAVRYDNSLYSYGTLLAGLDDVVWRSAEAALGEPMPGFHDGVGYGCGYIHTQGRPPAPPDKPREAPQPQPQPQQDLHG
ncbi:hypothetical protein Vretimale_9895 [Volvox reticuliferus]|uniref:Sulfotransferase domain-containing protein n=2 Tax=Volvox reticuliferus TaxID=1737510 RepID=A0A8J4GDL4_9CHLO|nr:hypothetical protein Vretimale_9895 [Volvox reticuliferus]